MGDVSELDRLRAALADYQPELAGLLAERSTIVFSRFSKKFATLREWLICS